MLTIGYLHGESKAPIETLTPPPVEHSESALPVSLNWRDVIEGMHLVGPMKMLAMNSQALVVSPEKVHLRVPVQAFDTQRNRFKLSDHLTQYFGMFCQVTFEVGPLSETTVADRVRQEREKEQAALVHRFRQNEWVNYVVTLFQADLDEGSVQKRVTLS